MKIFIDTADVNEIRTLAETGLIDGVTTNPTLVARSGGDFLEVIKEISLFLPGPISAEVSALDADTMIQEGKKLTKIANNVVIKVPLTMDGLKACKTLRSEGIDVNVTLCFSPAQALLAAKAGATYISPFVGRLDDIGQDGLDLIGQIAEIYSHYDFETQILAASIRSPLHVVEAARLGADVATIPPKIFKDLYAHPLTDKGIQTFVADWASTGQSIL